MTLDGSTIAAYTGLLSTAIATGQWLIVGRKSASAATVEILENRLSQYRKENRDLTDGLDECKRACRRCEERIEAAEENAARWRHEADHWKAVATGGSY